MTPADDFARGARFAATHAASTTRVSSVSEYDRGFAEALEAAQQILEQVAEARGTSAYDVLREVHEGLTAVRVGLRRDVVSGLKGDG